MNISLSSSSWVLLVHNWLKSKDAKKNEGYGEANLHTSYIKNLFIVIIIFISQQFLNEFRVLILQEHILLQAAKTSSFSKCVDNLLCILFLSDMSSTNCGCPKSVSSFYWLHIPIQIMIYYMLRNLHHEIAF